MSTESEDRDDEIQIFSDEHGIAFIGNKKAVDRFLESKGLLSISERLNLNSLGSALQAASAIADQAANIAEHSGRYVKLTKESAKLRKEFELIPTAEEGISHLMVGKPGKVRSWLQMEEGPATQLVNPALLTGISGILAQAARQYEAKEYRKLLVKIEDTLDDVRRGQKNDILSTMDGVAFAVQQAMNIREHGGDLITAWGKIKAEPAVIGKVEGAALRELTTLADKLLKDRSVGAVTKSVQQAEEEAGLWIAVLGRCFELQNELEIIELEYVARTKPELLEGHRQGLDAHQQERRLAIAQQTVVLLESLDNAGAIVAGNVLLHATEAQKAIAVIHNLGNLVDDLHTPLGIETDRTTPTLLSRREALRDRKQLTTAAKEAGQKLVVGGAAAALGAFAVYKSDGRR